MESSSEDEKDEDDDDEKEEKEAWICSMKNAWWIRG